MADSKGPVMRVSGRFASKKQLARLQRLSQKKKGVDTNTNTKTSAIAVPVAVTDGDLNPVNQFGVDLERPVETGTTPDVDVNSDDESELSSLKSDAFEWNESIGPDTGDRPTQPGNKVDALIMNVEKKHGKCDVVEDDIAQDDVVDMRPSKRVKRNDGRHCASGPVDFGSSHSVVSSAHDFGETPDLSDTDSLPPRPYSSLPAKHSGKVGSPCLDSVVATAPSRNSRKDLPPLLSPTLPPSLEAFVNPKLPASAPPAETEPKKISIKLIIMDKDQLETLKSHNGILRSHNLSLAKQNADLRADNCNAALVYRELQDNPLDHTQCVRKADYQEVIDENETLRKDITTAREERDLMQQCGNEWARLEIAWDTERELLKTEVTALVQRVGEFTAREHRMGGEMMRVASRALHMEQLAANETHCAMQLQEEVDRLVAEARAGPRHGSVYPEL